MAIATLPSGTIMDGFNVAAQIIHCRCIRTTLKFTGNLCMSTDTMPVQNMVGDAILAHLNVETTRLVGPVAQPYARQPFGEFLGDSGRPTAVGIVHFHDPKVPGSKKVTVRTQYHKSCAD